MYPNILINRVAVGEYSDLCDANLVKVEGTVEVSRHKIFRVALSRHQKGLTQLQLLMNAIELQY